MTKTRHQLFSYGTLQQENVQIETYGRILKGVRGILCGYLLQQVRITNPDVLAKSEKEFHPIAVKTDNPDDTIEGIIFEITDDELAFTDAYEVDDYQRVQENFGKHGTAWVYVAATIT
jgi:hypothetical protein